MKKMKIVQCWDDGLVSDIRLIEILRKHEAKASFNLNMGLYQDNRSTLWNYQGTDVIAPAKSEILSIFSGFDVANHSLSHPNLCALTRDEAWHQIDDNKKRLEDLFQQAVHGFCYPFGDANQAVRDMVEESGHLYARTVQSCGQGIDSRDPFLLQTSCHFLDPEFWSVYEKSKEAGVFYFWGHSYELTNSDMWQKFEEAIAYMSNDESAEWCSVYEVV